MDLDFILHKDILEYDVDAIVVPQLPGDEMLPDLTMRVYEEAGFKSMRNAYNGAKREVYRMRIRQIQSARGPLMSEASAHNNPIIVSTPGYNLKAKHVIHVEILLPTWREEQSEQDRYEIEAELIRYYYLALECASNVLKAKDVLFPLLGTTTHKVPEEFSRASAQKAISMWTNKRLPPDAPSGNQDDNTVTTSAHIVIPFSRKNAMAAQPADTPNVLDKFAEFEQKLNEEIIKSGKRKDYYCNDEVKDYLTRIRNQSKLEDELGLPRGTISKFKNQDLIPKKWRLIALAIGMELDDYERYKFIRCCGEKYPSKELDFLTENILHKGIRDFAEINKMLCDINPEYDLTKSVKNPDKKGTKNAPDNQKDPEK